MPVFASAADPREAFEARTFTGEDGGTLNYRLLSPLAVEPDAKYPFVLFLHGAGERGDDNTAQLVHGMADLADDAMRARHPAFVMAPQCPDGQKWVDVDWSAPSHTLPQEPSDSMRLVGAAIEQLVEQLPIDESRMYVTGLSMGGFGSWDVLARHGEHVAGAVVICGGGDPATAERFKDVPIWVFHGDDDRTVLVERSRAMVDALRKAGGTPIYTEYEGVEHDSWTTTYANRAVWDWLFAQRREEPRSPAAPR